MIVENLLIEPTNGENQEGNYDPPPHQPPARPDHPGSITEPDNSGQGFD